MTTELVQKVVENVRDGNITVGQLLTIARMYPANDKTEEIEVVRQALALLEQQEKCSAA